MVTPETVCSDDNLKYQKSLVKQPFLISFNFDTITRFLYDILNSLCLQSQELKNPSKNAPPFWQKVKKTSRSF